MFPPAKPAPTPEALAAFLDHVRAGTHPYDAARKVEGPVDGHETHTRIRSFAMRGVERADDPVVARNREFAAAYAAALDEWQEERDAAVDARYEGRALGTVPLGDGSDRMLHQFALVGSRRPGSLLERFLPLLEARTRHVHEGAVGVFPLFDARTLRSAIEAGDVSEEDVRTAIKVMRVLMPGAADRPSEAPALALPPTEHPDVEAA